MTPFDIAALILVFSGIALATVCLMYRAKPHMRSDFEFVSMVTDLSPRLSATWRDQARVLELGQDASAYAQLLAAERATAVRGIANVAASADAMSYDFSGRMRRLGYRFDVLASGCPAVSEAEAFIVLRTFSALQEETIAEMDGLGVLAARANLEGDRS